MYRQIIDIHNTNDSNESRMNDCKSNLYFAAKPQFYYERYDSKEFKIEVPFIRLMKNAKIIGQSSVVVTNNESVIYELFNYDSSKKYAYIDQAVCDISKDMMLVRFRSSDCTFENGISMSTNFSFNYFHFLLEVIPRFFLITNSALPDNIPLLIDEVVKTIPQFLEILSYFNNKQRKVEYLKKGYLYNVKNLYYVPSVNFIPPDYKNLKLLKYDDNKYNYDSLNYIRNTLLQQKSNRKFNRLIFLARADASGRRRYNESDLKTLTAKYGFEAVYTAQISVCEQVALFNDAEFIVGVSGASFANLLFCNNKCKILCIESYKWDASAFSSLARFAGADMQHYITGKSEKMPRNVHRSIDVDIDDFEIVLKKFMML